VHYKNGEDKNGEDKNGEEGTCKIGNSMGLAYSRDKVFNKVVNALDLSLKNVRSWKHTLIIHLNCARPIEFPILQWGGLLSSPDKRK
jgi:hypothetical protein